MPVTRTFTIMDVAKPVRTSAIPQSSYVVVPSDASQQARGDKLESACQMKID